MDWAGLDWFDPRTSGRVEREYIRVLTPIFSHFLFSFSLFSSPTRFSLFSLLSHLSSPTRRTVVGGGDGTVAGRLRRRRRRFKRFFYFFLFFPIYFSLLIPFLPPKFPNPNPKPLDLKKGKRVIFGCGLSGSVLCCGVRTVVLVYVVIRFRAVRVCYCWNLFRFVLCYGFDSKNQLWVC